MEGKLEIVGLYEYDDEYQVIDSNRTVWFQGRKSDCKSILKKQIKVMVGVQKYTCGAGDGMFDDDNGSWVEVKEYNRLNEYLEELYELAYNNCSGLAHDELNEIVKKYE